jgi:hypothetical protein
VAAGHGSTQWAPWQSLVQDKAVDFLETCKEDNKFKSSIKSFAYSAPYILQGKAPLLPLILKPFNGYALYDEVQALAW